MTVRITDYKLVGDLDDTEALKRALLVSRSVYFPHGSYGIVPFKLPDGVKITGDLADIYGGLSLGNDTSIEGVRFKSKQLTGSTPSSALMIIDASNIKVRDCMFDSVRIWGQDTNLTGKFSGISIRDCDFRGDYENYSSDSNVLEFRGLSGIDVSGNRFSTENSTRILKLSSGVPKESGSVKDVYVKRVTIVGNQLDISVSKQVIDLYSGVTDLALTGNVGVVRGTPLAFIQSKPSGGEGPFTDKHSRLSICSNSLTLYDGIALDIMGAYGTAAQSEFQSCTISGNDITMRQSNPLSCIQVKGLHSCVISGNSLTVDGSNEYMRTIGCISIRSLTISDNNLSKGSIVYESSGNPPDPSLHYDATGESISINSNILSQYSHLGSVTLMNTNNTSVSLSGNILSVGGSKTLGSVHVKSGTLRTLSCTGNLDATDTRGVTLSPDSTISQMMNHNNSWNF